MRSNNRRNPNDYPLRQNRLELQAMTFTDHELELLLDSIEWELDFLESSGWHETPRHQNLTELQTRIQSFLDQQ
jgi:hypothetical protein